MTDVSRRDLLAVGAVALAAPALLTGTARPAAAAAPPVGKQAPGFYRQKLGDFELTALFDGAWVRKLDEKFVTNAPFPEVQKAIASVGMSADAFAIPFTQLLVNTGSRLILIDTGTTGIAGPTSGLMPAALAAAGYQAEQVDAIVISHFHGDHINGIRPNPQDNSRLSFPNAVIHVPEPEWAFWMDEGQFSRAPEGLKGNFNNVRRVFNGLSDKVIRFPWGNEIVPGLKAIAAPGHTPGHTAFHLSSGDKQFLVLSDTTNHPALFVRNPEWSPVFDMDAALARETRRKLLDQAATDRIPVQGYHFPFPASGYITKEGTGFQYAPIQWQGTL